MATIQPEIIELREKISRLEESQQKLEVRITAAEKLASWWRLFTATALPIILAIFIAAWIQNGRFTEIGGRFDEISKRLDEHSRRIERLEQRMDRLEQSNQQILLKLQEVSQRLEKK